jgi:hypothetical protein
LSSASPQKLSHPLTLMRPPATWLKRTGCGASGVDHPWTTSLLFGLLRIFHVLFENNRMPSFLSQKREPPPGPWKTGKVQSDIEKKYLIHLDGK